MVLAAAATSAPAYLSGVLIWRAYEAGVPLDGLSLLALGLMTVAVAPASYVLVGLSWRLSDIAVSAVRPSVSGRMPTREKLLAVGLAVFVILVISAGVALAFSGLQR